MLKERCPACNRYYLGQTCPCQDGQKYRSLECDCGLPAVDVWIDDLGEWPLCERCLAQAEQDLADGLGDHIPLDSLKSDLDPYPGIDSPLLSQSIDEIRELLTPRELEVSQLIHLTNRQIADRLGVSIGTVKSQIHSAFQKLHIHSRAELADLLASNGEIPKLADASSPLTFTLIIQGKISRLPDVTNRLQGLI
jgi:DNA-binding CsgD family transcriptional regulator